MVSTIYATNKNYVTDKENIKSIIKPDKRFIPLNRSSLYLLENVKNKNEKLLFSGNMGYAEDEIFDLKDYETTRNMGKFKVKNVFETTPKGVDNAFDEIKTDKIRFSVVK